MNKIEGDEEKERCSRVGRILKLDTSLNVNKVGSPFELRVEDSDRGQEPCTHARKSKVHKRVKATAKPMVPVGTLTLLILIYRLVLCIRLSNHLLHHHKKATTPQIHVHFYPCL